MLKLRGKRSWNCRIKLHSAEWIRHSVEWSLFSQRRFTKAAGIGEWHTVRANGPIRPNRHFHSGEWSHSTEWTLSFGRTNLRESSWNYSNIEIRANGSSIWANKPIFCGNRISSQAKLKGIFGHSNFLCLEGINTLLSVETKGGALIHSLI